MRSRRPLPPVGVPDVGQIGIATEFTSDDVSNMFIAMIVAIHRNGGAFTMTRVEYMEACAALGVKPGGPAQLAWARDQGRLTLTLSTKPARAQA